MNCVWNSISQQSEELAIVDASSKQTISYYQLRQHVCALCALIIEQNLMNVSVIGIQDGDFVAALAVLYSGHTFVALKIQNNEHVLKWNEKILRVCDARFILYSTYNSNKYTNIPHIGCSLEESRRIPPLNWLPCNSPDTAAYICFTSGTTGEPKGVIVSRCGVGNFVQNQMHCLAMSSSSRILIA